MNKVDQVEDAVLIGEGEKVVAIFSIDTEKTEVVSGAIDEVEEEAGSFDGDVKISDKDLRISDYSILGLGILSSTRPCLKRPSFMLP